MESLFSTILEDTSIAGQPIESSSTRLRRLVQEQIDSYRAEHADINVNPLKWWKDHEHRFNFLSPVAKQLMAVMGTSVPSERLSPQLAILFLLNDLVCHQRMSTCCSF